MAYAPPPFRGSNSSPPRGLREAYERIVDEENLAAEESAIDSAGELSQDYPQQHPRSRIPTRNSSLDPDRLRLDHLQHSPSPVVRHQSRRSSPFYRSGIRAPNSAQNKNSLPSESGSESVVSSRENGAEDAAARTQANYARDQRRINGALQPNGTRIFSKARVGPHAGLTTENLRRRDRLDSIHDRELKEQGGSPASLTSSRSDPPLHPPQTWGSKSRKNQDWLRRAFETDSSDVNRRATPSSIPRRVTGRPSEGYNLGERSVVDWSAAAAEIPLPSVDASSLLQSLIKSTTPPTGKKNTALEEIRQWEMDEEFTARDLQMSMSPPIKARNNTALAEIRERELESLREEAVATSRLKERRESPRWDRKEQRPSDDTTAPLSDPTNEVEASTAAPSDDKVTKETVRDKEATEDQAIQPPPKSPLRSTALGRGEQIPNTPVTIYRSPPNTSDARKHSPDHREPHHSLSPQQTHTPLDSRSKSDSRDLLRKLARVSSTSPSPGRAKDYVAPTEAPPEMEVKSNTDEKGDRPREHDPVKVSDTNNHPPPPSKPTDEIPKETPRVGIGGWIDTPAATTRRPRSKLSLSSSDDLMKVSKLESEDTPRPLRPRSHSQQVSGGNQISTQQPSRPLSRRRGSSTAPTKPSMVDEKIRHLKAELEIDTTTDSLDELMARDAAHHPPRKTEEDIPVQDEDILQLHQNPKPEELPQDDTSAPLSDAERARRLEMHEYELMHKRLRQVRLSIRDASRGIEGLENKVDINGGGDGHGAGMDLSMVCACPGCGQSVAVKPRFVCHCWHPRDYLRYLSWRDEGGRLRFTWLGLILSIVGSLWAIELLLAEIFTHPLEKPFNLLTHYEPEYFAPRRCLVTYQFLRWYLPFLIKPFETLLWFGIGVADDVLDWWAESDEKPLGTFLSTAIEIAEGRRRYWDMTVYG
ncbi:MAG: hypothetical protein M1817_000011 [Caeruleum heppii]|nr:MAG: hypothetical protein M1817_000011 [Caeruleum heppii]